MFAYFSNTEQSIPATVRPKSSIRGVCLHLVCSLRIYSGWGGSGVHPSMCFAVSFLLVLELLPLISRAFRFLIVIADVIDFKACSVNVTWTFFCGWLSQISKCYYFCVRTNDMFRNVHWFYSYITEPAEDIGQDSRARLAWRYRVTRTQSRHLGRLVIKHSRYFSFGPPVYPSPAPNTSAVTQSIKNIYKAYTTFKQPISRCYLMQQTYRIRRL